MFVADDNFGFFLFVCFFETVNTSMHFKGMPLKFYNLDHVDCLPWRQW